MPSMVGVTDERSLWLARQVLPHERELRAWLSRRRLVGLDVDDIIQETYARLISAASVDHIRNPRAYAFQTAYSVLQTHLRRSRVISFHAVSNLDLLHAAADEPSPERQIADRDELLRLAEAIAALPEMIQAVFKLRRVDGLSQRAVAERLGISESTVEKHMSRGFLLMLESFGRGGKGSAGASKTRTLDLRRGHVPRDSARD